MGENHSPQEKVNASTQIRSQILALSDSERKVAEWILQHAREVLYLSMSQVALECGVSDTTVLRMSRNIGFRGYTDLKLSLAQDLASPTQLIHDTVEESDNPAVVAQKVFKANIQSLYDTLEMLDEESLDRAVKLMENARHILIGGVGGSSVVAQSLYQKLYRLGRICDAPLDVQLQISHAALLTEADLVIGITYSGITKDVVLMMEEARSHGAKVLCITGNNQSPASQLADVVLMSVSYETRSDALAARIAQMSLVDTLYVVYSLRHIQETLAAEKRIGSAITHKSF